jgi:hypothetical protein
MFSRKKDCFTFGCNFGRKKVTQANRAGSVLEKNDIGIRVQRKLHLKNIQMKGIRKR